ncbi:MAG: Hsp20/alpha crystallin family protein [Alphaproteobacteria bacterium]|nr:Hsp20/alpha crystallin family protein [Alphaproteobacteria bacterium]
MLRTPSSRLHPALSRDPMFRALDQLLAGASPRPTVAQGSGPRTNAYRTDSGWQLVLEVPGVGADALEITVESGDLVVTANSEEPALDGARALRTERTARRSFTRRFSLPDDADAAGTEAHLQDGLLTLRIPKQTPTIQRIPVQVG